MNKKFFITKILAVGIVILILPSLSLARDIPKEGETKGDYTIKYSVRFDVDDLYFTDANNYKTVIIKDGSTLNDVGKPIIPVKEIKVALPVGMILTDVKITSEKNMILPGLYDIAPSQPPKKIGLKDEMDDIWVEPDQLVYKSNKPYPGRIIEITGQTDLAGQNIGLLNVYPVQYIPSEKKLILYTSIDFQVTGTDGYVCGDYLPRTLSDEGKRKYEQMIKDMVINPDDVKLTMMDYNQPKTLTDIIPGGPYSHVIITPSIQAAYWAPLVEWHTKRGLKDTVVTTETIYANYAGSTNQMKIRNFIIDAYNTWGTMYFLLAGQPSSVPMEYRTYTDTSTPSDQYYSDFDDDWIHEVFVGRVTAEGYTSITRFLNKLLFYEKTPPMSNYILNVGLFGFDADASTPLENLMEIISGYIPTRFTKNKVYDSYTGNHLTAVTNYLNAGQHIVAHGDHGDYNWWGIGYYRHNTGMYSSNVDSLTNTNKMSIVTTLACMVNYMDHTSDCFSEHWVTYNSMKAGLAFTGNTRYGYYYSGSPNSLSGTLLSAWHRGLFYENPNVYILGETIIYSKHVFSTSNPDQNVKRHCEWTFNLLGEPSMPIWTDTPSTMSVSHPSTLPTGVSSFTVDTNVPYAYICLWKGNEVYLTGTADSNGDYTFYPSPTTEGTMYVTVTKHNYLPYEGVATVLQQHTLTINIDPPGYGYVIRNPDQPTYNHGQMVELTANPSQPGWRFDHWSGSLNSYNNPEFIIMDDDKVVTAHFVPAGFILNLEDFPMYQASYPYNEMCGAAVAQMTLNYIWWNKTQNPSGPPLLFNNQQWLYNTAHANNSDPSTPYIDTQGLWRLLQTYKPSPYNLYGYNFNRYQKTDSSSALRMICEWINYTVGTYGGYKPGHPTHVPALVPAYGGYSNWMAVRGIHTDRSAYPLPEELTIYGFWVNDPLPGGIGANSYKTASTWLSNYYQPMQSNDPYNGKYVAICEPPETKEDTRIHIPEEKSRFTSAQRQIIKLVQDQDAKTPEEVKKQVNQWIIQAAIQGAIEHLIPYDSTFTVLIRETTPGTPLFVRSLTGSSYYIVPFIKTQETMMNQRTKVNTDQQTHIVVIVDADDGSFKEASWTQIPVTYPPVSENKAKQLVIDYLLEHGLKVKDQSSLSCDLIHRQSSLYHPEWRVIEKEKNLEFFVDQNWVVKT